jgi:hypothetical protein
MLNIIYGIIAGIAIFAVVKIIVDAVKEMSYKSSIRKEADALLRILRGN